ncbi:alpha/beta hydrolase [bacterium]|nr:MAG: alpha/beta hydrolase [bacterium]
MNGKQEEVNFPSGGLLLEGILWDPGLPGVSGAIIVCHPHPLYGGDMHNDIVVKLSGALEELRLPILRFNFRGAGESEGVHDGALEKEDVRAAVDFIFDRYKGMKEVHLAGYSWGLVMALAESDADPRVKSVAGIAPPVGFMDCGGIGLNPSIPKIFVVGDKDSFAPAPKVRDWLKGLGGDVRVEWIEGADHFFFGRTGKISGVIVDFFKNITGGENLPP